VNKDGRIDIKEVEAMLVKLGVAPMIDPMKKGSASLDRMSQAAVREEVKLEEASKPGDAKQ
jgi:hypothetical protein